MTTKPSTFSGILSISAEHFYTLWMLAFMLLSAFGAQAQVTTSALSGRVLDGNGEPVAGAYIQATHVPTGSKYVTATQVDGRYYLPNLNPGGPYTLVGSFTGSASQTKNDVFAPLGTNNRIDFTLVEQATELSEVVVTGNKDRGRTGAGTAITREQVQRLPTLTRSLSDFTRLTPQSSNNSFAGTNFRYNNITLDGAINNDAIGFSPSLGGQSGTANAPGSSTRSNPVSLDAVQDIQVAIAPYNVTLGNFTGGSVNAVTRSGTNEVTGSVYGFGRNATITGKGSENQSLGSKYYDYQTGVRVGLPIIKDKLFFFTNEEITHRQEPLFYGVGQAGTFLADTTAQHITSFLASKGYNAGSYTDYSIYSKSTKFFNRVDWNISPKHQLAIRNNTIISEASNLERSATEFQFGNYDFVQKNVQVSTVAELKSNFSSQFSNTLILGYTNIHDYRNPTGDIFPSIQIKNVNGGNNIFLGTNREAGVFNMRQKTFEFTDNLTWFKGANTVTIGTHNELYSIDYGFINSWNGRLEYNKLTDFYNNAPARVRTIYNIGDNSRGYNYDNPSAAFRIFMWSAYAQDDIQVTDRLKVSPGFRVDLPYVPFSPYKSDAQGSAVQDPNYGATYTHTAVNQIDNKLFGQLMYSPRLGFNYDVLGNQSLVLRGGSGIFTGRIPFAWLGYLYYNNGVNFGAVDVRSAATNNPLANFQLSEDPNSYRSLTSKSRVELDLADNHFKMPQVWRNSLAADFKLPGGYLLTLEGIYTKVITDVKLQQVNLFDSVRYAATDVDKQQPIYINNPRTKSTRVDDRFSSVYLLSNTHEGSRYQLTAQIAKTFDVGFNFSAAYTYGQSKDILNGIRNSPESGWQLNQSLSPNSPQLTYSNFDIRHRIVATAGWRKAWSPAATTYVNLVFTGQSGTPYTYVNGTTYTNNGQQIDLTYVPNDVHEYVITANNSAGQTPDQQYAALEAFIAGDKYLSKRRGQFTERNGARTPWNNQLDLRLMQDFNFVAGPNGKRHTLQLSFDIINLTNLISDKLGRYYFVPNTLNGSVATGIAPTGTDAATGKPVITFTAPTATYSVDKLASRWQGQLGVRYLF